MSKPIDADKLKEAISEKTVTTRKTERNWYKNAVEMMELVDNQPEVLLSCPKCHGAGEYKAFVKYNDRIFWESEQRKCLICNGTGKVSIEAYEDYQEKCRGK